MPPESRHYHRVKALLPFIVKTCVHSIYVPHDVGNCVNIHCSYLTVSKVTNLNIYSNSKIDVFFEVDGEENYS
jgi:hypothetical protein